MIRSGFGRKPGLSRARTWCRFCGGASANSQEIRGIAAAIASGSADGGLQRPHAIAAAKVARGFFFFDPNFGCYEVPNELRLQQLLEQGQRAVNAKKTVEIYLASM